MKHIAYLEPGVPLGPGAVKNHAGLLVLTGTAETVLHVNCDRCGKPFLKPMSLSFEHMLADHLEDEENENDEIVLLQGTVLDVSDAVTDDMVYAGPTMAAITARTLRRQSKLIMT